MTRRLGAGTFVSPSQPAAAPRSIAELTSPLELIEVRLGIEPIMVQLAVLNATGRDIERLAGAIERMEAASGDSESFTALGRGIPSADFRSDAQSARWCGSIARSTRCARISQWNAMKDKVLTPPRIAEYNQQHRALYEAIRTRDVDAAVAIVTEHLHYAKRQLMGENSSGRE